MVEERRYKKRELARLYWPDTEKIQSAMKNLREDIKGLSGTGGRTEPPPLEYQQAQLFS